MAAWAREHGRDPAVHRIHGRRPLERLAARRGRPGRRARRRRSRRPGRSSRRSRRTAARSPDAGDTLDGGGEFGVISSVTQPFCGDCTRARISAEGKLYTCLFAVDGHDLGRCSAPGATDAELTACHRRRSGRGAATATPSCARRRPRRCPRSRCSRWAAEAGDTVPWTFSTACPQAADNSWMAVAGLATDFVDNRVDPSTPTARTVGLARRGRQDRRNRDRIKGLRSAAGRFGRFVATPGRSSHHGQPDVTAPDGT